MGTRSRYPHDHQQIRTGNCRPLPAGTPPLAPAQIDAGLAQLPGWEHKDGVISKTFAFGNYAETMAFVNGVAAIAQREDHHPEHAGRLRQMPRRVPHAFRRRHIRKRFHLRGQDRGPLPDLMLAGQVIAAYGRHYLVETGDGRQYACFPRGKKSAVACGDRVMFARTADEQGVIEAVEPRSTLFSRSAAHRQKLIAANVSQLAIVVAAEPSFSEELINRCLVAAEYQNMRSLILLNKCDLKEAAEAALARLEPYVQAGYRVIQLSAFAGRGAAAPVARAPGDGTGRSVRHGQIHHHQRAVSACARCHQGNLPFSRLGPPHHDPGPAVPAGRRQHPDRLPRPAGVRPASPVVTGHRSGIRRIPRLYLGNAAFKTAAT